MKNSLLLALFTVIFIACQNAEKSGVVRGTPESLPRPAAPTVAEKGAGFIDVPNKIIGAARQLTFIGPRSGEGYFSRDGKKMIFQSERSPGNPFYQMYVLDLVSGKTTRVSPGQGKTTCGWIHPSGKKVMWSSTHLDADIKKKTNEEYENRKKAVKARYSWNYDETYDIFESDLTGKNVKRLTKEKGYDAEGSYSPDGQWIAFASNRAAYSQKLSDEDAKMFAQDPSYMMDIYLMKSDGSQVKQLTNVKGYDGGPFFSPDGTHITWRRFAPNGATAEIYTMNLDGSDQRQITRLGSMSWAPFYHPSGEYIIFATSVLGYSNFELFIVDADGRHQPVRVTFDDGFDGLATFTPDGTQISWTHRNEKGESQILLADWDAAAARRALNLPPRPLRPSGFSSRIRKADAERIVRFLASEEMGGRRTGGAEEKVYDAQIAELFESFGLKGGAPDGGFLQEFSFTSQVKKGPGNKLKFVGAFQKELALDKDFEPVSFSAQGEQHEAPVVFAGYGIRAPANDKQPAYDSYRDLDLKGKWALILDDVPDDASMALRQQLSPYARVQHKITVARTEGAVGVIIVSPDDFKTAGPLRGTRFEGVLAETSVLAFRAGGPWVKDLFKASGKNFAELHQQLKTGTQVPGFQLQSLYAAAKADLVHEKSHGYNIIARLPGRNPKLAVLIGAHGDHLGRGEMGASLAKADERGKPHFGADDNASGVAAVLEIAADLAQTSGKEGKFGQDIYFAVWSGEEIGLLGSAAFVKAWEAKRGPFNKSFSAGLNFDMVGRLRDRLFVQGTGSGDLWAPMAEEMTLRTGLPMVLQEDPYVPSDAMTFYVAKIPSIMFFTGSHPEYHTPRDTADLINYDGLVRVAELGARWARALAETPAAAMKYVEVKGDSRSRMEGRSFRVYLGTIPDYAQEGVKGVRLSGVSKDSPAEKAGLQAKDVIVHFAGTKIENIYDYVYALQAVKPNVEVALTVRRGDKDVELKITPLLKE